MPSVTSWGLQEGWRESRAHRLPATGAGASGPTLRFPLKLLRRPAVRRPLERPLLDEPAGNELPKRGIVAGASRAHPRADDGIAGAVLVGIDVDAADHAAVRRVEDRVGEAGTCREVAGVALEVRAVLVERHRT